MQQLEIRMNQRLKIGLANLEEKLNRNIEETRLSNEQLKIEFNLLKSDVTGVNNQFQTAVRGKKH